MDELAAAIVMRDLRIASSPEANAPNAKRSICSDCGEGFWQRVGNHKQVCADCGARRMFESAQSMRNRAGPYYERFVVNRYLAAKAELERLGLDLPDPKQNTATGTDDRRRCMMQPATSPRRT